MPAIRTAIVVHDEVVRAKLLAAAPRILAQNRVMATAMLEQAKAATMAATPIGPGHFGYHGRDTLKVDVTSRAMRTTGKLKAAIQLYWREFGTRGYFRRGSKTQRAARAFRASMTSGGFGEPATMTAHKALATTKRMIAFYYGGAKWWRL